MAFDREISESEECRRKYQASIVDRMDKEEYARYSEVLFSTHSCAIEGNSFSVVDTRELKEKGLLIILSAAHQEYISALRMIRTEATDEHLVRFFFKTAIRRMQDELRQKEANTTRFVNFIF